MSGVQINRSVQFYLVSSFEWLGLAYSLNLTASRGSVLETLIRWVRGLDKNGCPPLQAECFASGEIKGSAQSHSRL
jgi:hypothetical protein